MRYLIELKDWIYVKCYEFLSFAKNIGENLIEKYRKKFLDNAKKIYSRCNKTCFKKN